ncbi:N-acetylmuramoyl-L-alanine amidase, partial [bacterium]|nr:N-acetylmuramoyl-L-alanine amidase [bacterium]
FLNTASSKAAERLAAIENKGAGKKADDLQTILMDMLQNINTEESKSLAENVQKEMVNQLSRNYSKVSNLGVQSALFYVLAGTKCPGVLVETSFISNPREEFRLKNYNYQMRVASSITAGVKKYVTKQEKKYSKR